MTKGKTSDNLNEKCAVFGIFNTHNEAARQTFFGLFALQHRGQEQSGIVSTDGKKIYSHKGSGLVTQVFNEKDIEKLKGFAAIGHNRYSTSRGTDPKYAQPFIFNNTVSFAHNGNLPSTKALVTFLKKNGVITNGSSDSELMAKAIGFYMKKGMSLPEAVQKAYPLFTGAFSCVALSTKEMVAFRDPRGIRPLVLGKTPARPRQLTHESEGGLAHDGSGAGGGKTFAVASETCALRTIGIKFVREVLPGEMIIISKSGIKSKILAKAEPKFDIFEFVYFSRHDCWVQGKSVYQVRKNFGKMLFEEHPNIKVDIVVPVPETAIPFALGYSQASGVPFELGLNKNRYIHRTFIEPAQASRDEKVRMKLTVLRSVVSGKRVAVIDDSIVRGTTSRQIVKMFFHAGAKEVHFMVGSAPVKFPDFYGIDTPKQEKLIASHKSVKEICKFLGATSLSYLSIDGMVKATGLPKEKFCLSAFNGEYPLPIFEHEKEVKY